MGIQTLWKLMKKVKQDKAPSRNGRPGGDSHSSKSSMGMGDFYGRGVKQKIGKMREGMGQIPVSKKQLGTKPRSVA